MDNLKIVYKILVYIEKSMDRDEFDSTFFKTLEISKERLNKIIQSMIDDGLIAGFDKVDYYGGYGFTPINPRLTIKGMEFLSENSTMQKIKNGLKDITPFI